MILWKFSTRNISLFSINQILQKNLSTGESVAGRSVKREKSRWESVDHTKFLQTKCRRVECVWTKFLYTPFLVVNGENALLVLIYNNKVQLIYDA